MDDSIQGYNLARSLITKINDVLVSYRDVELHVLGLSESPNFPHTQFCLLHIKYDMNISVEITSSFKLDYRLFGLLSASQQKHYEHLHEFTDISLLHGDSYSDVVPHNIKIFYFNKKIYDIPRSRIAIHFAYDRYKIGIMYDELKDIRFSNAKSLLALRLVL